MKINLFFLISFVVLIAAMFLLIPKSVGRNPKEFDPEAVIISKMIQARVDGYAKKLEERRPIVEEIAKLQAQVDVIEGDMAKLAEGAAGFDHTLCKQYGVKYVRAGRDDFPHLEDGCSFR